MSSNGNGNVRAYVTPDTQQPRTPQRGATPSHHPYCIMVSNGHLVQGTVNTPTFRRLIGNIPSKRAAERIAAKIRRGEDAAVAAFDVLG